MMHEVLSISLKAAALLLAGLVGVGDAVAQSVFDPTPLAGATPAQSRPQSRPQSPPAVPRPQQPSTPVTIEQALYLVRSTLLTLNDANRSGNYTVLRDLAAPDFQARNSAADLAISFSDLRQRGFDLFAAAIAAPQLTVPPALDDQGMLRLSGIFATRPLQISFALMFQNVAGTWRLFAISVATPEAPPLVQTRQQTVTKPP